MTPEEKSLLERTYKMAEENNAILRGMRRMARWNAIMRATYWTVIIGVSVGAFYFIQPYLDNMFNIIHEAEKVIESVTNTPR